MKKSIAISLLGLFFLGSLSMSYSAFGHERSNLESASHGERDKSKIMEDEAAMAAIPPAEKRAVSPASGKQPPEEEPAMAAIPGK